MAMQTPGAERGAGASGPVVGDLQVLVHLGAYAVTDVRPHDVASPFDCHVLHRPGHVLDV
jgi:hypothetical protein